MAKTTRSVLSLPTLLLAVVVAALTSCGPILSHLQGSGHPATESRQVGSFSKIEIEGSGDVVATVNPVASLTVTTDDNLLPVMQTEVDGDTLKIRWAHPVSTSLGVKVRVAVPSLKALSISGSGTIVADGIKESAFSVNIAGSGEITTKGTADSCDVAVSGSGQIEDEELVTHDAEVAIAGSGSVTVYADHSLDASITGSGSIRYLGNPPQVKKSILGIGSIDPR